MVRIEVQGLNETRRYFRSIQRINNDLRPFWRDIVIPKLKREASQVFQQEGPGWQPLSRAYAYRKSRQYPGKKILVRTGRLKDSYINNPHTRYNRHSLEFGPSSDLARIHEEGRGKTPKRSVLDSMARNCRRTVGPLMSRYLTRGYRQAGRRFGFG